MKKRYSALYLQSKKVQYLEIPTMTYFTFDGVGDPNTSEVFKLGTELLYKLSYKIKMTYKTDYQIEGYHSYHVAPLEGIWSMVNHQQFDKNNKENLKFKLMINQPSFVTKPVFDHFIAMLIKEDSRFEQVHFEQIEEGQCVQILHIGAFNNEPETLAVLFADLASKGLSHISSSHHEIYLSDSRKVTEDKLKTIIRYQIDKATSNQIQS